MASWKVRRFTGALLGILGLVALGSASGFGAPDPPAGELRTAVFFVA